MATDADAVPAESGDDEGGEGTARRPWNRIGISTPGPGRGAKCEEQVRMVKCRFRRYIDLPNPKEKNEQPPSLGNAS
jgi:hypothetical protein